MHPTNPIFDFFTKSVRITSNKTLFLYMCVIYLHILKFKSLTFWYVANLNVLVEVKY